MNRLFATFLVLALAPAFALAADQQRSTAPVTEKPPLATCEAVDPEASTHLARDPEPGDLSGPGDSLMAPASGGGSPCGPVLPPDWTCTCSTSCTSTPCIANGNPGHVEVTACVACPPPPCPGCPIQLCNPPVIDDASCSCP